MFFPLLLQSLYFFLPAYLANMAPVLLRWLPGSVPIHEHWFGGNKTWRGLVVAVLVGGFVFWLQKYAYALGFRQWTLIDYNDFSILMGFLLGAGAILGDLFKSFWKRRYGISPGERWIPWDQLDFVMGGIVFSFFLYVPPVEVVVVLLVISPLLHVIVNHIGYWVGIRKEKW